MLLYKVLADNIYVKNIQKLYKNNKLKIPMQK